jgi:hypothetical protein
VSPVDVSLNTVSPDDVIPSQNLATVPKVSMDISPLVSPIQSPGQSLVAVDEVTPVHKQKSTRQIASQGPQVRRYGSVMLCLCMVLCVSP